MPANPAPDAFDVQAAREVSARTWLTDDQRRAEAVARAADLREADCSARAEAARSQDLADALAERQRIAAIARAGRDSGRARQATRLALLADLDEQGARAILASLPADHSAPADALAIPSAVAAFGCPAAQAERGRIAAILGSEAAQVRPEAALGLAVDTGTDASAAAAVLAALPVPAPRQTLEQRSRDAGDFGADPFSARPMSKQERSESLWKNATKGEGVFYG